MNRSEHVAWCKARALEYVVAGDLSQAFASMCSDLMKHDETRTHMGIELGMMLNIVGRLSTERDMRNWITGFN